VSKLVTSIVGGRAGTGIIGLVGLAWTGIGVVEASRFAMARVFHRGERLPFLKRKAAALGTLVTLGPLSLAGAALTGVVAGLDLDGPVGLILRLVGWLVIGALAVGLFAVSYRVLVPKPGPPWRDVVPGAVLAAVGWVALQLVGAVYVSQVVTRASAVYGSLAAIIGLLILLHLGARVFLYGAVLNAELVDRRRGNRPGRT
jgi:membrane protein